MKPQELTTAQCKILLDISHAGVVVEYFLAEKESSDLDSYTSHRQTALLTLEKVKLGIDKHFESLLLDNRFKHKKREDFFQVSINEEKLTGKIISLQEFMNAYTHAFFEPPYTMRGSAKEKENHFNQVENLFFDRFDAEAVIYQWSDECSNYFDAGKEWWGTYFYTYSLPDPNLILGIAASTTD